MTTKKVIKSKRIIPDVDVVALVDSAANGSKVLLMKSGQRCDVLPPELVQLAGGAAATKPSTPAGTASADMQEFEASWRKVAGM